MIMKREELAPQDLTPAAKAAASSLISWALEHLGSPYFWWIISRDPREQQGQERLLSLGWTEKILQLETDLTVWNIS